MSNEPNQPAEDAPEPKSQAGGQATPAAGAADPNAPKPAPTTEPRTASQPPAESAAAQPDADASAAAQSAAGGAAAQPDAAAPAAAQPGADASAAAQSAAGGAAAQPDTDASAAARSAAGGAAAQPDAGAPAAQSAAGGAAQPDAGAPAATPSAAGSAATQSDPSSPAAGSPAVAQPDGTAQPGAAASATGAGQRYLVNPDEDTEAEPARDAGGAGKKAVLVLLAIVVAVGGFFGIRYFVTNNAAASAGDCVSLSGQNNDRADVQTLDCGDDKASFKVGKVLDQAESMCPEEGLYTEVSPTSSVGDGYKLCLLPNMVEGACYKPDEGVGFAKGECVGTDAFKVTKVINDSTDLAQCPDSAGMSYPEPAITYCLAPAEL
ncbi:LppU/SCO3897 family protein [Saccharothrix obliqua]|uniref:LppU/SCO3897 family protein n=1 Tax=Saccharothrix obliqua TaxID=2861747 RepID=UPI001C5EE866|nr:hypothetical protein [Saccharothrix obliqua]MBW4718958.1 hypothetical protein [Saccharothrix obliqua]